jgi:hypothetical protein
VAADLAPWRHQVTLPVRVQHLYVYFCCIRPFLDDWAAGYDHLREVTRSDVRAALGPLSGSRRATATSAMRSLFEFAKKRGLIFSNPTTGLKGRPADFALLPMADEEIQAIEQPADDLAGRVIIALAAENAARTGAIRHLTLDDLDLANRRITLAGRRQRLGDLSHRALRRWLRHRRTTWPHTNNPHVLISDKTAHGTGPISQPCVTLRMNHIGCTVDRIRKDRILHEALAARADPLHLSLVFGPNHRDAEVWHHHDDRRNRSNLAAGPFGHGGSAPHFHAGTGVTQRYKDSRDISYMRTLWPCLPITRLACAPIRRP